MATLDPQRIRALVEEAVSNGASTVEEIHKSVAAAPLQALSGLDALSAPAATAEDLSNRSIGAVYETIRQVTEQVGILAEQVLDGREDLLDSDPE